MLDRQTLIATLESRLYDSACAPAFLLLVVLEDGDANPVVNPELVAKVGRHVGAMIRSTDLIADLDRAELAVVVFDLPPVQRIAFADGIAMAVNGILDTLAPHAGLRALLGTSPMRPDAPITDAFRQADRQLRPSDDQERVRIH